MKYYPVLDFFLSIFGLNSHFIVIIENSTRFDKEVSLFTKHNFGFPDGIKVGVRWWGYKRLLSQIKGKPFEVSGFTIKSKCNIQISESVIKIERSNADGVSALPLFPKYYVSPTQEYGNYAHIYPCYFKFEGLLGMHLNILPKERVELIFTKKY